MAANLLTSPLVDPISLSEMKAFLKLETDGEDDLLRAFISAARVHLEHMIGRHLITQSWRVALHGPLQETFTLSIQPVTAIKEAAILSADGDLVDLSPESFVIRDPADPARISNIGGVSVGMAQRLQIDVETGFGPTPEDVPESLRMALRLIVAEWHERRLIAEPGQLPSLATALGPLIAPYRSIRL